MLRRVVLRERHPAGGLDFNGAERAVGSGARQNDAGAQCPLHRHERAKEVVDRVVRLGVGRTWRHRQHPIGDGHDGVGLDHEDGVGRNLDPVNRVYDLQGAVRPDQFGEMALGVRTEVLDHDDGQAGVGRQRSHELRERLQTTRGGSNPDDWVWIVGPLGHAVDSWGAVNVGDYRTSETHMGSRAILRGCRERRGWNCVRTASGRATSRALSVALMQLRRHPKSRESVGRSGAGRP